MKKFSLFTAMMATTALSSYAMDIKTTGVVDYKWTKIKVANKAQNGKLSQNESYIKFIAQGVNRGLQYGAFIKTQSGTAQIGTGTGTRSIYAGTGRTDGHNLADANLLKTQAEVGRIMGRTTSNLPTGVGGSSPDKIVVKNTSGYTMGDTNPSDKNQWAIWRGIGYTQDGQGVWARLSMNTSNGTVASVANGRDISVYFVDETPTGAGWTAGKVPGSGWAGRIDAYAIGDKPADVQAVSETRSTGRGGGSSDDAPILPEAGKVGKPNELKNNLTTQSALWVSGDLGKLEIGQSGDASTLAPSGQVKSASFDVGTQVAKIATGTHASERLTYTTPKLLGGFTMAYTHTFKGNVNTDKSKRITAPTVAGIQYTTNFGHLKVKLGHAEGTLPKYGNAKTIKNTQSGIELNYGKLTVGYGQFKNGKKAHQTKDVSGTAWGVKLQGKRLSVGYTVMQSTDKNKYLTHSIKTARTNAISASYRVADGFDFYLSRSTNTTKFTTNKTAKKSYAMVGLKIAF